MLRKKTLSLLKSFLIISIIFNVTNLSSGNKKDRKTNLISNSESIQNILKSEKSKENRQKSSLVPAELKQSKIYYSFPNSNF